MLLTDRDRVLLSLSITQAVEWQVTGQTSAVELLGAYVRRAGEIQAACNAFICFVPDADAWAARCDAYIAAHAKPIGRLHGMPCTVKDHVMMRGLPLTMGSTKLKKLVDSMGGAPANSAAMLALRAEGANIFAKTNMSQQGDTWGAGNPAFGDTLNPWSTLRTCGGSSSGEGAAIGGAASAFGLGSDIAGSVRIPASFCGISALKPTVSRMPLSTDDSKRVMAKPGDYGVQATLGPMARRVEDLVEVCRAVWARGSPMMDLDVRVPPLYFDEVEFTSSRRLRIGFCAQGYTFPAPCPGVVRVVARAADALRDSGHELVPFEPAANLPWERIHPVLLALQGVGRSANLSSSNEGPLKRGDAVHPDLASMALVARGPGEQRALPTSLSEAHDLMAARDASASNCNIS